eukprot:TRINITY_DN1878_c13_g1_i1.p1 TRINITY_DN1878_c13_g1~~TRINITY_DN1878_c13_g1_i1.p1  ORF type:complete len:243 (+),score=38.69 TRINITY_DN1878_c13_g1_i1:53-781(+)
MPPKKKTLPLKTEHKKTEDKELWTGDPVRTEMLQKVHKGISFDVFKKGDLQLEDVVAESPGLICVVRGFLTPAECSQLIKAAESAGLNPASKADLNPRKGEALLDRWNLTFSDPVLSDRLFKRLQPLLPPFEGRNAISFSSKLRYYRYDKSQQFEQHVDVCVREDGYQSEYTLLIYLNGIGQIDLIGGETVFYSTKKKVLLSFPPEQGALLLHAHGKRCLMHKGDVVKKGSKYVLRTDVLYG